MPAIEKHETIHCERCNTPVVCKANNYARCQCSTVQLSINEMQYISEMYDACLCAKCLTELRAEYKEQL